MVEDMHALPWWAAGYLCVLYGFSAVGLWEDFQFNRVAAIGGFMSLVCVTVFVISFHSPQIASHFGWLFLPMTFIGIAWEFTQAVHETGRAQEELSHEVELSESEKNFLVNMAAGLNALLVVPGYAYGLMLCYGLIAGA